MKITNKTLNRILLLIILVGVFYVIFFHRTEPTHILDPNIQWKTDTIKVPEPYAVPEPYGIKVPPRIVKIYEVDSSALDSLKLIIKNDSITIAGLHNQINIHSNYLKLFPTNPKLIALDLSFDTLSLSLLNISGIITSYDYPIFIEFFKYHWSEGQLTKEDNIRVIPQNPNFLNYKAGLGYDLLFLTPYIQGEISKDISKFDIYGRIGFGLLNNKASEIRVGVNYNFK